MKIEITWRDGERLIEAVLSALKRVTPTSTKYKMSKFLNNGQQYNKVYIKTPVDKNEPIK